MTLTTFVFRSITLLAFATAFSLVVVSKLSPRDVELDTPLPLTIERVEYVVHPTADEVYAEKLARVKAEIWAERRRNWAWLLDITFVVI